MLDFSFYYMGGGTRSNDKICVDTIWNYINGKVLSYV